jgi:hypothetical protein
VRGALKGLAHAHVGWLLIHTQRGRKTRYAPDLMRDPDIAWIDRTFIWWAVGGFVVSFVGQRPRLRASSLRARAICAGSVRLRSSPTSRSCCWA